MNVTETISDDALEPERYELQNLPDDRLTFSRRDLFRLLGAGAVVFLLLPAAEGQESGGARRGGRQAIPQEIGAWLHIGANGVVTAYTGKVEVGQNSRTSLTQAIAEELRVPVASVQLVMGDTDLTPYDMGTFGSRTTPTMAPQMRKAAAAAREILLDLAVKEWQADRAGLVAANGHIAQKEPARILAYAQLLRGQKLTQTIGPDTAIMGAAQWTLAGQSVPKVDGRAFVTGGHRYTSDMHREGMLYGKILRPAAFGARLKTLDSSAAQALPGVTVVQAGGLVGVTARTSHEATRALAALKAEWDTPPQVSGEALFDLMRPRKPGDAAQAPPPDNSLLQQATYTVAYIAHAPLEPRAALAEWEGDRLTVWTGTQRPFGVRSELAAAFGIPEDKIRVIVPDTGSGYGGKHTGEAAVEAARLAKGAGRPVKVQWSREEEFAWAYFRPAGVIDVAAAVSPDGALTVWEFDNYNSGSSGIRSPYEVPGQQCRFHEAPSPLRQGSYRGLAATANHFAREAQMDDLARSVKMDPLAFRLKNLKDDRMRAVLEAAAERFGWKTRKAGSGVGFGLACGSEKGSYTAHCAEVAVDRATGKVKATRIVAAFECGGIVNPTHLQNQVEGSTVMGLGGALFEAIQFDAGRILNARFSRYRVPRFADIPPIEVALLDRRDLPSAGAGETPIVSIAPALRNAILDATGIALRSLPLVPNGLKA